MNEGNESVGEIVTRGWGGGKRAEIVWRILRGRKKRNDDDDDDDGDGDNDDDDDDDDDEVASSGDEYL